MTDPTPRPDDELVSAVLDGEAALDERALVEGDPAARARLAELAAVRDRVAAPVTVPADTREQALAAALAAFDAPALETTDRTPAGAPTPPDPGPPDELAARRARRSGSGGRYLAVAAAIVVVLFGAGVALRALNPAAERSTATSSDAASPSTSPAAGESGAEPDEVNESTPAGDGPTTTIAGAQPTAPATTTAPVPALDNQQFPVDLVAVELGVVGSARDLRAQMLDAVDGRAAGSDDPAAPTTSLGPPALARAAWTTCASYLDAVDVELDQLLAVASATVDGQPVLAYAFSIDQATYPAANGSVRIYAVDPTTCATVSVQTTR